MVEMLAILGSAMLVLVAIPAILTLVFLFTGRLIGAIVCASIAGFLFYPEITLVLLVLGGIVSLVIGRADLTRVCVIMLIVLAIPFLILSGYILNELGSSL